MDYGIKDCKLILRINLSYMACWMIMIDLKIISKIGIRYVSGYVVSAGLGLRIKCWIIGLRALKLILNMNLSYMLCWMIPIDLKIIPKIGIDLYLDMW